MQFESQVLIKGKSELLTAYKNALAPEASFDGERANYTLKLEKDKLKIKITAKDATAFRAIMTSMLGLISIISKTAKNMEVPR